MLPRSSEAGSGAIGWLQWLKITWNYFWTPRFNPLTVIRLLIDLLHCATCLTTSTCLTTNVTNPVILPAACVATKLRDRLHHVTTPLIQIRFFQDIFSMN